jgi:O-antigen/teichoic acid export membrane protein
VFGNAYKAGRTPLVILMVATALMAVTASMHPLYIALVKDRDVFTLSLGGALVNVAANAVAIPAWGMTGAAYATLATQAALLAIVVVRLRQRLA